MDPSRQQYLSTTSASGQGPNKKLLFIIIGGVLALLVAAGLLIAGSNSSPTTEMQRLDARVQTLTRIVERGQDDAIDGQLRRTNSDLYLIMLTTSNDVSRAIASSDVKPDKAIIALEADADTFTDLDSAKANGRFDEVYSRTVDVKIDETRALIQEVINKSNRRELIASLTTARDDLGEMQQRLSDIR